MRALRLVRPLCTSPSTPRSAAFFRLRAALAAVVIMLGPLSTPALASAAPASRQARVGSCPNTAPPPPVDTSEVPAPGMPSPALLPMPDPPVGGEQLGACGVTVPPGSPLPPAEVSSKAWVVADLDSGKVLAAKNPHDRHRPASTIKVLTALLALRELEPGETVVVTQQDAAQEGSTVGLVPGVTYTVEQVLTGMLMQSGNDAAHALAAKLGGPHRTITTMNELAAHLGARDTRAASPSGLDGPGMSTSAYDLALLFQAAMRHPEFARAIAAEQFELPGAPGGPPMRIGSDNAVLFNYPGALGGKTGFTDDARHTFLGAAERSGRRLVAVLLRGENQPIRLSAQTMRLLDYGFELGATGAVGELVPEPRPAPTVPAPDARTLAHGPQVSAAPVPAKWKIGSPGWGAVGSSLALLVMAGTVLTGVLAIRRHRATLAATRAARTEQPEDHP